MFDPSALRVELAKANLKAFAVAKLAGVDPGTVYAALNGKNTPQTQTLQALAKAIGCSVTAFFAPSISTQEEKHPTEAA